MEKEFSGSRGVVLCFKVDSPEQVDRLYKKVIESGFQVSKAPWDAFWGQRYCSVLDPDQNQVDIFPPYDSDFKSCCPDPHLGDIL